MNMHEELSNTVSQYSHVAQHFSLLTISRYWFTSWGSDTWTISSLWCHFVYHTRRRTAISSRVNHPFGITQHIRLILHATLLQVTFMRNHIPYISRDNACSGLNCSFAQILEENAHFSLCFKLKTLWKNVSFELFLPIVSLHVPWKRTFICKLLGANCAFEWFIFCVSCHVRRQITLECKILATNCTRERSLSCVSSHVWREVTAEWKVFITKWTLEWFISCVIPHVCLKVTPVWKPLRTNWTSEWFLSSVSPHMFYKIMFKCKLFITNWTPHLFFSCVKYHVFC